MNWNTLRLLYAHELRMLVRARRTVVMAVVIPLVIMPIMLFASRYTNEQRERSLSQLTYTYTVTGRMASHVRDLIARAKQELDQDTSDETESLRSFKFAELKVPDPALGLEHQSIYFYIQTYTGEEADRLASLQPADHEDRQQPKRLKTVPLIRIVYRGNNDASNAASQRMETLLHLAQRSESQAMLIEHGFQGDPENVFSVDASSVATAAQVTGSNVGRYLTVFLVMLMLTGGSIAAMDIIAGEKERGTIETLLTTAAGRTEIVTAKQMAIVSVALTITLIQALNFLVYVKLNLIRLPENFALDLPISTVITLLLLFVPLAAMIAASLLLISARAKTYKEAQMYFFPVYMTSLIPSLASVLPGLSLRSAIVVVPLANVSVAVREILTNRPDPPMIAITFLVMAFTAGMLMRASARMLSREEIIVPAQGEPEIFLGGEALFQRRVLRWFAVMWALMFAVAANVPQLATFRRQLLFNELGIFGGGLVLMLVVYRLDIRKTLMLRPVKWPVWIAVILAAPAGNLVGVALFKLLNYVIPVSQELEQQMAALMPQTLPSWQLYLFIGVIPGVIEELAFRGLLLHGLRRRIRPVLLPLAVGMIFGMFHFTLFRIGPTAFLGILLTVIAILTGSVFPGMVLHALNNSFAVWASDHGWPLNSLDPLHYVAATVIFALAMWIVYRNRTPVS
jgi:sodium transport system permease protein